MFQFRQNIKQNRYISIIILLIFNAIALTPGGVAEVFLMVDAQGPTAGLTRGTLWPQRAGCADARKPLVLPRVIGVTWLASQMT